MKNKLFYLLWVAYAGVVIFILQINQVFSPGVERTSMEKMNIIINLGFLVLIGVLFAISTKSFISLHKISEALRKVTNFILKENKDSYDLDSKAIWEKLNSRSELFGNKYLDKAMGEYRDQLRKKGNSFSATKFVPIDDFINEPLLEKAGMSYFNSAMPGTLTGIGILGTFLGLSLGLASFSGNDIYTISDNIGPLLSGMKVAFHTSIYGIFFSLIFTFIYRSQMSAAYEKLDRFLTVYRHYTNQAIKESEATSAMLVYQANTAALLKDILNTMNGRSQEQTESMAEVVDRLCKQMTYTLGTDVQMLGQSLQAATQAQAGSAELFRELTATAAALVEENRRITEAITQIANNQEAIERQISRQEIKLGAVCDDISARLYTLDMAKGFDGGME